MVVVCFVIRGPFFFLVDLVCGWKRNRIDVRMNYWHNSPAGIFEWKFLLWREKTFARHLDGRSKVNLSAAKCIVEGRWGRLPKTYICMYIDDKYTHTSLVFYFCFSLRSFFCAGAAVAIETFKRTIISYGTIIVIIIRLVCRVYKLYSLLVSPSALKVEVAVSCGPASAYIYIYYRRCEWETGPIKRKRGACRLTSLIYTLLFQLHVHVRSSRLQSRTDYLFPLMTSATLCDTIDAREWRREESSSHCGRPDKYPEQYIILEAKSRLFGSAFFFSFIVNNSGITRPSNSFFSNHIQSARTKVFALLGRRTVANRIRLTPMSDRTIPATSIYVNTVYGERRTP